MHRLITLLILLSPFTLLSQSGSVIAGTKTAGHNTRIGEPMTGLWGVTEVKIGDEVLTPTAKWFQLNADSTSSTGNGWLQNGEDSWKFDDTTKEILFINNGIPDEYGPFKATISRVGMTWERSEDGQKVVVNLRRIGEKPKAPWDDAVGIWKVYQTQGLDSETKAVKNIYSLDPTWYRIRWDRYFVKYDMAGERTQSGIWHMDAHQPTLTLFDAAKDTKEIWEIHFKNGQMIWTRDGDDEILQLTFQKDFKVGN